MQLFKKKNSFDPEKIFYGFSSIFPKFLSIVFIPIILRLITPSNWGKISILLVVQQILIIVFNHGLSTNLFKNYTKELITRRVFLQSFVEILVFYIFIASIFLIFDISSIFKLPNNPIIWMTSAALFQALNTVIKAISRILERPKLFLSIVFSEKVFIILFQFILVLREVLVIGYDSTGIASSYFIGTFMGSGLVFLIFGFYIYLNLENKNINKEYIRTNKLLSAVTISTFSFFLISWFDRFVILELLDFNSLGIYSAYDSLARLLRISIEGFLFLYTAKIFKDKNDGELKIFRLRLTKLSFYFLILGILVSDLFIEIILLDSYSKYSDIVFPLGLSYFLLIYVSLFQNHMIVNEHYKKIVFVTFSSCILNIFFNFILVPTYGIYGAAYSTLISVLIIALTYIYFSKYYIEMELKNYFYMFITIFGLYLIYYSNDVYITVIKLLIFCFVSYKTLVEVKNFLLKT